MLLLIASVLCRDKMMKHYNTYISKKIIKSLKKEKKYRRENGLEEIQIPKV